MTFLRSGCTSSPHLKRATLLEISRLDSPAAAPFGPFSFWHIPGQRGKKSVGGIFLAPVTWHQIACLLKRDPLDG
jgi:hypothetical protein